ncbi:uncharacterized protein [Venturia canescens]|uniref:uncharacterized protein n=1 Tax=Venturia canescens TaxID=32260 RepID=UPI001C9CB660|nr:uncharacterized protein LOC122414469 [Venturia canescens]
MKHRRWHSILNLSFLVFLLGESWSEKFIDVGSRFNLNKRNRFNDTFATCVGENYFYIEDANTEKTFDRISCEKYPNYIARKTQRSCLNGTIYEIGFPMDKWMSDQLIKEEFHTVIDLCHDNRRAHTIYAHATIQSTIDAAQKSFPRTSFRKGIFYSSIPIHKLYGRDVQRETIAQILGSWEMAKKYVPEKGQSYLARGHLVAKADFVYGAQQRATFFYANVVPMWQNINAGNWATMENSVRLYASKRDVNLEVWTGSIGTLRLEDERGRQHEIFLHFGGQLKPAVPVPKVLFKVVYSPRDQAGIVFLTANNPFLKKLPKDYKLCEDVCYKIDYVSWKPDNAERGLSYCCEIDDFRQVFHALPCLGVVRLLL